MTVENGNSSSSPLSNSKEVSPYALSGRLPDHRQNNSSNNSNNNTQTRAERGCQTESGGPGGVDDDEDHDDDAKRSPFADGKRGPSKHLSTPPLKTTAGGGRYQVAVEVHHLQHHQPSQFVNGRQPFNNLFPNKNDDGDLNDNDESDDYVTLMRKSAARTSGQNLDDVASISTSSNAGEMINSNHQSLKHWRKTNSNNSAQTVTVRYRSAGGSKEESAVQTGFPAMQHAQQQQQQQRHHQNGGRSSSGNWSAATSDLLQSSSTSSSPLHPLTTMMAAQPSSLSKKRQSNWISKESTEVSTTTDQATGANSASTSTQQQQQHQQNDEAESVYSVDNDGYFTSMHTDSGLLFGHTPMTVELMSNSNTNKKGMNSEQLQQQQQPKQQQLSQKLKKSENNGHSRLLDRKALSKRFERIQEEQQAPSGGKSVNGVMMLDQQQQQQLQQTTYGSNESINSILSNSDATSVAVDEEEEEEVDKEDRIAQLEGENESEHDGHGMMLLSPMDDTASSLAGDFDCSVSHCSHQFSGHRGHQQLQQQNNHNINGEGRPGFLLGHRAHHRAELEEKRRLTAAAIRMMHQRQRSNNNGNNIIQTQQSSNTRLRTVSGTSFDNEDDEDNDDETLR
ncbi:PREDICTED: bromodomain-containing protein DDB_G0280777-like, partial [Rhagoletis zephyria]|uniref:bromodomain-containing protein DDB_G0280777-like n=1 Tax=Rhagoletis zephyria TaxID=28612 RepID=UPI00081181EC